MKLELITKLDDKSKRTSKTLTITLYKKIVKSLLFFKFLANLEHSGKRIICKTCIFIKSKLLPYKNLKQKNLLHSSHAIAFSKNTISSKKR